MNFPRALGWCVLLVALAAPLVRAQDPAPAVTLTNIACIADSKVGYAAHPSLAGDGKGTAWLCWLSRAHGGVEQVMAKTFERGVWSNPYVVASTGMYDTPVVACAKNGKPLAAWVAVADGRWEIVASRWDGDKFGAPQTVVTGDQGRCRNPALAAGKDGTFALAWEAYKRGAFHIYAKVFDGQKWGPAVEVGEDGFNCYNPAVRFQGDTLWLAFSKAYKAKSGMRDLILAERDLKTLSVKQKRVAASGARMGYPSLMTDSSGKLWIAGVHLDAGNMFKASSFAICFDNGEFKIPEKMTPASLPVRGDSFFSKKATVTMPFILPVRDSDNATFPVLVEDCNKHVVALLRNALIDSPNLQYSGRRAWGITAAVVTEQGWSSPVPLIDAEQAGRKDVLGAVALADGTVLLVWQQDNIYRLTDKKQNAEIPVGYERSGDWTSALYSGLMKVSGTLPSTAPIGLKKVEVVAVEPQTDEIVKHPSPAKIAIGNSEYSVLWGNIHEHSDISVCNGKGTDGGLDDNYRHHLDAAPYDFVSMTDHTKNFNEFIWRAYIRASEFYNDPPYFISFVGNENSGAPQTAEDLNANLLERGTAEAQKKFHFTEPSKGYGHFNIFFPRAAEAEKFVAKEPSGAAITIFSNQMDGLLSIASMCAKLREVKIDALVIPHQLADPGAFQDWDAFQPDFMPVCEIFQSRGSYEYRGAPGTSEERNAKFKNKKGHGNKEGCYVHDAFAKGLKFGFIASGDHSNIGLASTAVLVKEKTPAGIFEALRAARCYATSTPGYEIMVDCTVNGHLMGERVHDKSEQVKIVANINTKHPIETVALFKNGKNLLTDGTTTAKVEFVDKPTEEACYYYLRVVTAKGIAWTSPVWISRK